MSHENKAELPARDVSFFSLIGWFCKVTIYSEIHNCMRWPHWCGAGEISLGCGRLVHFTGILNSFEHSLSLSWWTHRVEVGKAL